jgi:hypothetical protein
MKTTVSALLATSLAWGALSACGEKHDILGTRADGGSSAAGTAGSNGGTTGGTPAAGGAATSGGSGGKASGGAGGGGGQATGGNGTGGGSGQAGAGDVGGAGGASGSGGNGGSSGVGMTAGGAGGNAGEAGAGIGGTAGTGSGGAPTCATDCRPAGACVGGEVSWTCGNGWDHQEFVDGGCTDQGTALPRYCCPPEFHADCKPCADATTLEDCESRSYCHPVFTDMGDCNCAPIGCCTFFTHCAEGALANCTPGPITCAARPTAPFCAEPAYVVSYTPGCTEGCVKPEDCSTPQ